MTTLQASREFNIPHTTIRDNVKKNGGVKKVSINPKIKKTLKIERNSFQILKIEYEIIVNIF